MFIIIIIYIILQEVYAPILKTKSPRYPYNVIILSPFLQTSLLFVGTVKTKDINYNIAL